MRGPDDFAVFIGQFRCGAAFHDGRVLGLLFGGQPLRLGDVLGGLVVVLDPALAAVGGFV